MGQLYKYVQTESNKHFKPTTMEDIQKTIKALNSIMGIPVVENSLVPKNEIWIVNNKREISKIVDIGNSRIYRFIWWWKDLFNKIKKQRGKLNEII